MNARLDRTLPFVLSLGLLLLCLSTGLSAQTPIETSVNKLANIVVRIAPTLCIIGFVGAGAMMMVGYHDSYNKLFNVIMGSAVALGAVSLVNFFR